jgi:hypothetical protein
MTTETTTPLQTADIVVPTLSTATPPVRVKGKSGRPPIGPQTDRMMVSMSTRLLSRFDAYCAEAGYSRSDATRQAIESMLMARGH